MRYNIFRVIFGEIIESGKKQYGFITRQKRAETKKRNGIGAAMSVTLSLGKSSLADKFFTDLSTFTLSDTFPDCAKGSHMQAKHNRAHALEMSVQSYG